MAHSGFWLIGYLFGIFMMWLMYKDDAKKMKRRERDRWALLVTNQSRACRQMNKALMRKNRHIKRLLKD